MDARRQEGHRRRLRQKFLKSGLKGFHDYEIIELLLTLGTPRRDCKDQAKEAIERFKTLRGVLAAPPEELEKIKGLGPANTFAVKFIREAAQEFLKKEVLGKPVCKSSKEVFDYLSLSMRDLSKEKFKVMFLSIQNEVIEVEDLFEGTLTASAVYPREIVEGALRHKAASLIFAHNHPSGNPEPSAHDKHITRDLVFASNVMQMKVLDHLIVGNNCYFSFADEGLIDKYEREFLALTQEKGD